MSDPSSDVNPLDALAEEFVARHRRGERPSLDEFIARRPDLADDIRDLFPGLVLMEGVRPAPGDVTGPFEGVVAAPALKRLGDYRVLREVGRGGMGVVYEAEQESLGRHVALKVLPAHALLEPQRLRRFHREAKAAARLHHTNIVPVYGVGEQDGLHYYVMQFIQGQGLDQVLDELKQLRQSRQGGSAKHNGAESAALSLLTGKFAPGAAVEDDGGERRGVSPPVLHRRADAAPLAPGSSAESGRSDTGRAYWGGVARIGIQTAQALAYAAAQGTLHRDVKPSNLLLDGHGNLWVTDFGLAKAADSEDLTHTGDIVGTLRYMAPERFGGKGDLRSDLYSLGLTLYELLALRPAFAAPDRQQLMHQVLHAEPPRLRQLDRAIPRDLETVVHKAIDREPARRYQTAEEMADDLQRFLDDRPIRARRVGALEKAWRWARRNPLVAGLSAAVALLLVGLTVGAAVAAYSFRETAAREANLAAAERRAAADANAARKEADDNAGRLRDSMDRLYQVNGLMERSRTRQAAGDVPQAHADLTKAVERMPEYALVWRERAELYYRLGLEEEALADLEHVFELKAPDEPQLWLRYAGLRLQQGDVEGYRAVCSRMADKFASDDKDDPIWLSLACCLGSDALPSLEAQTRRLEEVIKSSGQSFPWTTTAVLAAVDYRAGRFDEAERRLNELGDPAVWGDNAGGSLFLLIGALIEHRKGKDDLAERRFLQAAERRLEKIYDHVTPSPQNDLWATIEEEEGQALYREAAAAIRGADDAAPPIAWERRAFGHMMIGQKDRAAADLTQALRRKPDDPDLLILRAGLYADTDQWDRADADLARFAALKNPQAYCWISACRLHTRREDWGGAADLACQALDVLRGEEAAALYNDLLNNPAVLPLVAQSRPNDFDLRLGCARAYQQDFDKQSEAVQWATEALRLKPDDPDALRDRAESNAQLGRWREAAADFDHLLKVRPPQKADDLLPLALLRAYLNDHEGYRQVCQRMVDQFGKDPKAAWVVADAVTLEPNDVAESVTGTLAWPANHDLAYCLTYARICLRHGKAADALPMLIPWSGNIPAWYERVLALVYHRLGRAERARECMKEADDRERMIAAGAISDPGAFQTDVGATIHWRNPLHLLLLRREADAAINAPHRKEAEECLRNEQWKGALEHLNTLLKADPAFWPDLVARGVAYAALGEQKNAEADFAKAKDLNPASPYFWWARGRLYAQAGLWDQAAADLGKAYELARPNHNADAALAGYQAALVLLQKGDADGYRRICRSLLKDHDDGSNSSDAEGWLLWSSLLGADGATDYEPLLKIAANQIEVTSGQGVVAQPYRVFYLAALHYRAGQYQEAERLFDQMEAAPAGRQDPVIDWLDRAMPGRQDPAIDWFFRAMTCRRVGRTEDAKRWMDKAVAWTNDAEQVKLPAGQKMADWPWNERLLLSLLRREAEAVLKEPAPKPDK